MSGKHARALRHFITELLVGESHLSSGVGAIEVNGRVIASTGDDVTIHSVEARVERAIGIPAIQRRA